MRHLQASTSLLVFASMFCAMGGAHAQPTNELSSLLAEFREASDFLNQLETAQKLVDLGDAKAVPPMEVWLEDEDRHVRGNAAFVLAGLGEQRGLATLFEILDDYSDRPLGQGMPGIVGNTSVDGWWIRSQIRADRYYAVHLLGLLGNREAIPRLTVLASDPELSEKAAWALNEIRAGRSRK